jgi:hypothetical protein
MNRRRARPALFAATADAHERLLETLVTCPGAETATPSAMHASRALQEDGRPSRGSSTSSMQFSRKSA